MFFFLIPSFGTYFSAFLFLFAFLYLFLLIDETAISLNFEGEVWCRSSLWLEYMCQVVLAGWLELKWVNVVPGAPWVPDWLDV